MASISSRLARAFSWIMKPSGTEERLLDRKLGNVTTEWDMGTRIRPREGNDEKQPNDRAP